MSHLYMILRGGTVVPGTGESDATAIAWAQDTVLIVGSDEEVTAISRGDSTFHELGGSVVVPLDAAGRPDAAGGVLEIGGAADLAVLDADPRVVGSAHVIALVRRGRVVEGALPSGNRFERMVGR